MLCANPDEGAPSHPPGKPSSRGFGCSEGEPFATWRTISVISSAMTSRAVPVVPVPQRWP
jgi:hypothetical protein